MPTITYKVTGVVREVRNAPGTGKDSIPYIGYAEDDQGTGFSTEPGDSRNYVAFLFVSEPIEDLNASHFAGKWKRYAGAGTGDLSVTPATSRANVPTPAPGIMKFFLIANDEDYNGGETLVLHTGTKIINIPTT